MPLDLRMASLFSLPNELVMNMICARFPCRDPQIQSLATLLAIHGAPSRNLVLYGLEATGKTAITKALLEAISSQTNSEPVNGQRDAETSQDEVKYAVVKSPECISGRHLLEQTVGAVAKAVDWKGDVRRCENLAQLVVEIGKLLEGWTVVDTAGQRKQRFVLVFDGIDRQRDAPPTLLPALARLGEAIPNLTTIFIVTAPRPNFLHLPGVPHIHFPPYTKQELLQVISLTNPTPELPSGTKEVWTRFCSAVYDSLTKHSGRDILSFRTVCARLWPSFIRPIQDGTYTSTQFSRVLVANRSLFQNDNILVPSIITTVSSKPASTAPAISTKDKETQNGIATQLPYYSRLLLVASYLASFNQPRHDAVLFMKAAASKRRKRGGGTALSRTGTSKHRKISRKLLGPQAFGLERMLAIFHAIKSDAGGRGKYNTGKGGKVEGGADIMMAIATLASLRLIVKMGAVNAGDTLEGGVRYRVAVGWEVVRGVARSVGVEAEDYLAD